MSIQNYSNKKGITVAELKKVVAEWPETDDYGEPREVWLCTGVHLSSPVKHLQILNRRVHEDDTVSSDLLISPGDDHEWEHDTKLRADLETAENTALRMAEKADALRELLNEACASLDGSYNATDYPADGTSEQEMTRDKIRDFLSKL